MIFQSRKLLFVVLLVLVQVTPGTVNAQDEYITSAHGSAKYGVLNPDAAKAGYSRGNCTHCHVLHGDENGAYSYTLFAESFDTDKVTGTYTEESNFCFSCHNELGTVQKVSDRDYSSTSGCSSQTGPLDVMASFNQKSSHNLYDIWKYMSDDERDFGWFKVSSNPCSACHNSHNARSRKIVAKDEVYSAVSKPSDHLALWTENMGTGYQLQYEPPFCSNSSNREPGGNQTAQAARVNALNYVSFCQDCHARENIPSTDQERILLKVDWGVNGEIHGGKASGNARALKPPYQLGTKQNYVLSCMDCHESHGSANLSLLRTRVNGGNITTAIETLTPAAPGTGDNDKNSELGYLCMQCHQQDSGTGDKSLNPPAWEGVHHDLPGSPYTKATCDTCHPPAANELSSSQEPITCNKCHFHGSTDIWLQAGATGNVTF